MALPKIPDGLTIRISTNIREKTTRITAYRQGGFKRAYKAVLPMCDDQSCRHSGPHVVDRGRRLHPEKVYTYYHQRDVDSLVAKLVKSYR